MVLWYCLRDKEEKTKLIEEEGSAKYRKLQQILVKFVPLAGAFLTVASTVFAAGSFAFLQSIKKLPPTFEINAVTYTVALFCSTIDLSLRRELPRINLEHKWSFLLLCLLIIADDVALLNPEAGLLPLGSINAIQYGFTIIFCMFLSWMFLNASLSWIKVGAVMVTLMGLGMNAASELPIFGNNTGKSYLSFQFIVTLHPKERISLRTTGFR